MTDTQCILCGAEMPIRYRAVVDPQTRDEFDIVHCKSCGIGRTVPTPSDMEPYYGDAYYGSRHGVTAQYCASRRLKMVNATATGPGRRLLDIGCGPGTFLLAAQTAGWTAYGSEMNPEPAREAGLNVAGTLDECAIHGPYDCITLWHSLEHMTDPLNVLQTATKMLSDGGTIIVAVPDYGGVQARSFGGGWFHLDVPRHLFHFEQKGLTRVFHAAGLTVARSWHQEFEYDVFGWIQSALNAVVPEPNLLFNALTSRRTTAPRADLAVSAAVSGLLAAPAILMTAAGVASHSGGTVIFAGRKV